MAAPPFTSAIELVVMIFHPLHTHGFPAEDERYNMPLVRVRASNLWQGSKCLIQAPQTCAHHVLLATLR